MQRKVRKKLFQKNILILFCVALIFSPFSSLGELAYAEAEQKEQLGDELEESVDQENESDDSEEEVTGSLEDIEIIDDDDLSESLGEDETDDISEENTTDTEAGEEEESSSFEEEVKETDTTIQPSSAGGFQILAATPEDDYEWEDNGDGTVTITEYTGTDTNIVIPDVLDGKPVTGLGNQSFHQKNIQSIILPDTIKTIDGSALSENQLTSIDLPDGLERIYDTAFFRNKLTAVEIPSSVELIGNSTFSYNEFTSITLYGQDTYIVSSAFDRVLRTPYDNLIVHGFADSTAETYANEKGYTFEPFEGTVISIQAIDDIEVPFGMKREDISLPEEQEVTVEINGENKIIEVEIDWDEGTPIYNQNEVGTYMFEGKLLLDPHMKNPNNLTAEVKMTVLPLEFEWSDNGDGTVTITGYNGSDTEVFIPKQIDGQDVTIIGEEAFDQLGLTKVTLPNTLKTVEKKAFNRNNLIAVNIPEGVTSLGEAAFRGNKLETVIFPSTLQTMGDYVFTANKLKEIELPDSLTDMGIWAFRYNKLESIKFPKNLSEIPGLAFEDNQLTSIEIPDFVEVVRIKAFNENPLEEVIIYNENLQLGENVFAHETRDPQDVVIKGYAGSTAETYADDNNHTFDPFIEIPDENLKRVINRRLGKTATSELTATDLEGLTDLNAYRADISDLTGLQYATNLIRLDLESNNINDIFVLEDLINLESIDLGGNNISDITSVKNLTNLKTLLLDRNDISNISVLENLTNIEFLELSANTISDITSLENLTNLHILYLGKVNVIDFSILARFTNLIELSLNDNNISDISALENLTNLEWLFLENNEISDISVLKNLTNLEEIYLANNKVSDLSPLGSYFNNLQDGSLDGQEVTLPTIQVLDTTTTLEIDNPITFHDGSIIEDNTVQDGTYDSPKIKWNVTGTEPERTFTFAEQNYAFSGTVTQPIEWIVDEEPVIHASDRSILLNEPFDPLYGVTSMDKESGDLTNDIQVIKNEVDTSKLGTYEVTYSVTDHGGQTVEKTIHVTVTSLQVTDVADIADITVDNGTDKADLGLPTEVEVTLNDGNAQNVTVTWDDGTPTYNKFFAGNYVFTGTLDLPTGVANKNDVKANIKVTVGDSYVTDVTDIADIIVVNGTAKTDIGLPTEVEITLNNGSRQHVGIEWDNGDPAYNKYVAGNYVFTGILDLPTGVANKNDIKANIKVIVGDSYVTDIANIADITVANGTDKSDIGLPTEVDITLNDDSIQNVDVVWDDGDPAYDKSVVGNYVFTGTLDLPAGVVNTNDVEVTVTVAPQQLILPLDIKTEVFAGQVGIIEGTDTQITFPHDLPSGTFVTITDVSGEGFVTNAEGIERAGDVLDFKFDYPSGQSYTASFELTMSHGNGFATEIDIYYYNENDAKWEAQNGTMDTSNNTITINPDHSSTYGVFALKEEDKPGDDPKGNGESEGSAPNGDGDNGNGKPIIVDGDPDDHDTKGTGDEVLPKTATNTFNMIAVGLILLVLGGISLVFIRRRALKQ